MNPRRPHLLFLLLLCLAASGVNSRAQSEKIITVRILDSRTARPVAVSSYLVRIDRQETVHGDWLRMTEDGPGKLTVPASAAVVSIHVTYDSSMKTYVNCDSVKDGHNPVSHWYQVSKILTSGVVAPNGCSKLTETANPGEFIFFVRKQNWREDMQEYSAQ